MLGLRVVSALFDANVTSITAAAVSSSPPTVSSMSSSPLIAPTTHTNIHTGIDSHIDSGNNLAVASVRCCVEYRLLCATVDLLCWWL